MEASHESKNSVEGRPLRSSLYLINPVFTASGGKTNRTEAAEPEPHHSGSVRNSEQSRHILLIQDRNPEVPPVGSPGGQPGIPRSPDTSGNPQGPVPGTLRGDQIYDRRMERASSF